MKAFRVSDDCTFISRKELEAYVSANTINNGISLYKSGQSKNWATIEMVYGEYVMLETLSKTTKDKLGDIDKILADAIVSEREPGSGYQPSNDVELILDLAWTQTRIYSPYFYLYEDRYFYSHEILTYSQMHSFCAAIKSMKECGDYKLKDIHGAVLSIRKKRRLYNFKVGNFKYFKDKIKVWDRDGIECWVIHGNKHKAKENIKLTKFVKRKIIKYYVQVSPRRLSYQEITDEVNKEIILYGYPTIHLSSTKKFLGHPDIQNRFKPFRFGKEWAKKYLDPTIVRAHPLYIHDKWEIDGTVLPFYVWVGKKITRLWIMIIVDVHSRKIIGYGVDYHETANLAFNTYRMAIATTGCLAFEIVRDNAKAFDSKLVAELETEFESDEYKCFVRKAKVGNPEDKGTVEKMLDILNVKEFSKCEGWIGDPWNSERELYRLESQTVTELRKPVNVLQIPTVLEYVERSIKNINEMIF
jgi:hypothetical protein